MLDKKYLFLLGITLISFFAILDLFKQGLPLTHDGQDHVARIANFYQNLIEGNIIPRWAGNLNWGYGHPILEFLYPLPSYIASFFHFLGFGLVNSVKIVFGLGMILSGLFMYSWLSQFLRKSAAFVGAILYVYAPYRFVDLYVRGAIGEHMAFVFLPLVLFFLYKISKRLSAVYIVGGSFSLAGLVLSHNAISLMFLPIVFLYALFMVFFSKRRVTLTFHYLATLILGFGLSSFFWIPAFIEGKYTLRDIVTDSDYSTRFVAFKDFIYGKWSFGGTVQLSKQVGVVQWFSVIASFFVAFYLFNKKNKLWIMVASAFLIFWLTIFLMTSSSIFLWEKVSLLQKFQFPWRFLSVSVFASSVLAAFFVNSIPKNPKKLRIFCVVIILLLVMFFNKSYWHAQDFLQKPEKFFTGIYNSTTDTGESAPIWSVRFMEKRPQSRIEVVRGSADIGVVYRTMTTREYLIRAYENTRILENTLYFPGWTVFVDSKPVNIEFQDQNFRGLITFNVEKGNHVVNIIYQETKLRFFANLVSLISLFSIFVIIYFYYFKNKLYNIRK